MEEDKKTYVKRLSELKTSERGIITKVFGHGSFRHRITEMGFVRGQVVTVIKNAPLLDPIEYEIMGYRIALRNSEAELIEVSVATEATGFCTKRAKRSTWRWWATPTAERRRSSTPPPARTKEWATTAA